MLLPFLFGWTTICPVLTGLRVSELCPTRATNVHPWFRLLIEGRRHTHTEELFFIMAAKVR